jgi:hypothetical protein
MRINNVNLGDPLGQVEMNEMIAAASIPTFQPLKIIW